MRQCHLVAVLGLFATAACQPAQPPAQPLVVEREAEPAPASVAPGNPLGEYEVAVIDGIAPEPVSGQPMRVSIGPSRIHYGSQCVYADWTWRIAEGAIATERYHQPGLAMCARGLSDAERALEATLDGATRYTVRPDGGLLVEGGGHTLLLARHPSRPIAGPIREAARLTGEYRLVSLDRTHQFFREPITVRFEGERLSFASGCIGAGWSYAFDDGAIAVGERQPQAMCRRALEPVEDALIAALPDVERAELMAGGLVDLTGGGHTITLSRP